VAVSPIGRKPVGGSKFAPLSLQIRFKSVPYIGDISPTIGEFARLFCRPSRNQEKGYQDIFKAINVIVNN
jgi:hypothetical protein